MTDDRMEDRLRRAFQAHAAGVAPEEDPSLDRIRHRAHQVHTRRRALVAGVCAVLVLAGVAILPNLGDDGTGLETTPADNDEETPTTTEPEPTTTSTIVVAPPPDQPPPVVVWPYPGHAQYTDPVETAESFMAEYIGYADAPFGELRTTGDGHAEIDVYSTGEDGSARTQDVASTIYLEHVDGNWLVVSAKGDEVVVEQPADFATVHSPVAIDGRGRGFEGTIVVEVRETGMEAGDFLSQEPAVGGCCETLEPFHIEMIFGVPTQASGSILLVESTGLESAITDFTVVPVLFSAVGDGTDTTEFDVFFVNPDEDVVAVDRVVPRTPAVLRAALEALLGGPLANGMEETLSSAFPASAATVELDVTITDGTAVVDFASAPFGDAGLSATQSELLLRQLHETVFQFATVEQAEYRVAGSCAAFWEPLQRDCTTTTPDDPGV